MEQYFCCPSVCLSAVILVVPFGAMSSANCSHTLPGAGQPRGGQQQGGPEFGFSGSVAPWFHGFLVALADPLASSCAAADDDEALTRR